ncbi:hypothetical protein Cfor_11695 [Coptotermes formosanus]|uniref:Uncharacterized protein n=1 Tax=Coptotermes formosanus TaxID=36987 RepID=A0A6L2PDA3_COPFO|nr:hypothetical protein Cfor_11695 [Coptotermes formosanus]
MLVLTHEPNYTELTQISLLKSSFLHFQQIGSFSGVERGFIPSDLLMFRAGSKSGHFHDMNHANCKKWLQEKLIPNLESKSVTVVDSASYHNVQVSRHPTSNAKNQKCSSG